jgi:diamine N-acetyltransferase
MDNQPIVIRVAHAEDAALIADMSIRTFYEAFAKDNTPSNMDKFLNQVFTRQKLMEEVGEPTSTFLLAYQGQVPVGYARMRESENPPELGTGRAIEIARIYVEQAWIGRGVGRLLMESCLQIARERHFAWIWLGVWEHNRTAHAFYSRFGFERFGEHLFMLGDDPQTDWLMKKSLDH